MKLCIIVPNAEYLGLAGVRIRYNRIATGLQARGHELSFEVIDEIRSAERFVHDVYLFSKCYDARSLLIAQMLRDKGKVVGVDMFDDYFSQTGDSRFVAHRDWLRAMARLLDYFLCSTARMHAASAAYLPGVPGHVLNDPFDTADPGTISERLQQHQARMRATGIVEVAWFGVGDNPHFPVGLCDLHAYAGALLPLARDGLEVRIRILTNRRALTADGLERLARLPFEWSLDEWTLDGEAELLACSLLSFIPVNAQPFSIAKSLNRAVTALTAGTQVLSPGYPLYAQLGEFIYDDGKCLADDLRQGHLRVRTETVSGLMATLTTHGDPGNEAMRFGEFIDAVLPRAAASLTSSRLQGVVQGVRTLGTVHQLAQRLKQLSIGSPFSVQTLNYDLRFVPTRPYGMSVQFSEAGAARLGPSHRSRLTKGTSVTGRAVQCLDVTTLDGSRQLLDHFHAPTAAQCLIRYEAVMDGIRRITSVLYPGIVLHRSEGESPYHAPLLDAA